MAGQAKYEKAAVVIDIRGGQTFEGLFAALEELERMGCAYQILFVEAVTETIVTSARAHKRGWEEIAHQRPDRLRWEYRI